MSNIEGNTAGLPNPTKKGIPAALATIDSMRVPTCMHTAAESFADSFLCLVKMYAAATAIEIAGLLVTVEL
jgi:hypothetical protein